MTSKTTGPASSLASEVVGKKTIDTFMDEHEQSVVDTLVDFKNKESIQKLTVDWNAMSESKKMKLYNNGRITVRNAITYKGPIPRVFTALRETGATAKLFTFAPAVVTSLIYFGILPKPEGLTDEQIQKDVVSDGKNVDMMLYVLEGLCIAFPELLPALPMLRKIHPIANVVMHSQAKISQAVYNASISDSVVVKKKEDIYRTIKNDDDKQDLAMAA